MVAVANAIERSDPVVITGNRVPVDDAGARTQAGIQARPGSGGATRGIGGARARPAGRAPKMTLWRWLRVYWVSEASLKSFLPVGR
jgi:hypothetical protein